MRKLLLGSVVSVALLSPWLVTTQSDTSTAESPKAEITTIHTVPAIVGIVPMVDYDEQYEIQVTQYLEWQYQEDLRIEAQKEAERVEAERLRQEQEAARLRLQSQSAPAPMSHGSGDCAAVAAVVGWGTVQHESGGNPMAENGIYKGCAQIGMPWWNGPCGGLDWTNPADQGTCAQIVMGSQGPSAWAGTYSP